jgi:Icc-related predicted phosphoesterase
MVKFQLVSDLHLNQSNLYIVDNIVANRNDSDVLAIAGDLCEYSENDAIGYALERFSRAYRAVYWALGNHWYYGTSPHVAQQVAYTWEDQYDNVVVGGCVPRIVPIDGLKVIIGTGWHPCNTPCQWLNDYRVIDTFPEWFPKHNRLFTKFVEHYADVDQVNVVISHHAPSKRSITERYKGHPLNPYFVLGNRHFEKIIKKSQIKYWVHGHMHEPVKYQLGGTNVLCQPCGYAHEGNTKNYTGGYFYVNK